MTFNSAPSSLDSTYGKSLMGFWLFLRIRPGRMKHDASMTGMSGMSGIGDMH